MRIVLDTNVLISALLFGGTPQKVLEKVLSGGFTLVLSREILMEFEEVLCSRKFRCDPGIAHTIVREIEAVCEIVTPTLSVTVIEADPYDNMVLGCALHAKADYIVSGDAHLLDVKVFEGIPIVNPTRFPEIVKTR